MYMYNSFSQFDMGNITLFDKSREQPWTLTYFILSVDDVVSLKYLWCTRDLWWQDLWNSQMAAQAKNTFSHKQNSMYPQANGLLCDEDMRKRHQTWDPETRHGWHLWYMARHRWQCYEGFSTFCIIFPATDTTKALAGPSLANPSFCFICSTLHLCVVFHNFDV